jgi:hypothetical protein
MWRAFFYAAGLMLIILGVECIVVGRFRLSPDSSFNKLARKVWGESQETVSGQPDNRILARGFGSNPSQFGPSRFNNDPFFNVSNNLKQNTEAAFNLPRQGIPTTKSGRGEKTITTEDWMPWSLIAAGAIISLYTQSLNRNQE